MTLTTEQLRARIGHLKERLRDMKQHKYPDNCPNATAYLESLKAERQQDITLLEELLANREAQPVEIGKRSVFTCSSCGAQGLDEPLESRCHCMGDGAHWAESALYTAPPAPAVPDIKIQKAILWLDGVIQSNPGMKEAVTCRAAMLAQPVSQGYKSDGGWISCSDRLPDSGQNIITLNNCGGVFGGYIFKKYTDGSYVFVDAEEEYREDDTITHWMALPAAPGVVK